MITQKIDYLVYTIGHLPRWADEKSLKPTKNTPKFYKLAWVHEPSKAHIAHGHPNSDRFRIELTGASLDWLSERYDINESVRRHIEDAKATFSRADFALTIDSEDDRFVTVSEVASWCAAELCSGSHYERGGAKSILNATTETVETLYVGAMDKRAKKGVFRAYDKGLQQGGEPNQLTRFEVEYRRNSANVAMRRYNRNHHIGGLINARVEFDTDEWRAICGAEADTSKHPRESEPDSISDELRRWHWLIDSIAPVLGRQVADDFHETGDVTMYAEFLARMALEYDKRIHELDNKKY